MDAERRTACIILAAAKGDVRAARGLVSRAIRRTLGVAKWYTAPHFVDYVRDGEEDAVDPRFTLLLTDDEYQRLSAEIHRSAKAEGWDRAPTDSYHD